jgi:hypothetical protein
LNNFQILNGILFCIFNFPKRGKRFSVRIESPWPLAPSTTAAALPLARGLGCRKEQIKSEHIITDIRLVTIKSSAGHAWRWWASAPDHRIIVAIACPVVENQKAPLLQ